MCEAGTNQEQFQALFDHPTHSIQILSVRFEYRYVHGYETSKYLQEVLYVPVCVVVGL